MRKVVQATQLANKLQEHHMKGVHINLIPWNPVDESDFQRPNRHAIDAFRRTLVNCGIDATVRRTRGMDAAAACGQLRNEFQKHAMAAEQVTALK
jgi:23S rRNA (adenine2503-C2)-methyltransferase